MHASDSLCISHVSPRWDALVAQTQSVEAQLRQARYEGKQLSIIRVAQDDENRLLREQVRMLTGKRADLLSACI